MSNYDEFLTICFYNNWKLEIQIHIEIYWNHLYFIHHIIGLHNMATVVRPVLSIGVKQLHGKRRQTDKSRKLHLILNKFYTCWMLLMYNV